MTILKHFTTRASKYKRASYLRILKRFLVAIVKEYNDLKRRSTFEKVSRHEARSNQVLPLI